jgi:chromosomal replication initiator protein
METTRTMQRPPLTLTRFVRTRESRLALAAVLDVLTHVRSRPYSLPNPLLLHGPAGCGKTHLVSGLVSEATRQTPDLVVSLLSARDFGASVGSQGPCEGEISEDPCCGEVRVGDLLVVEDLQHLPTGSAERLADVVDDLGGRQCPMVFTALAGPRHLSNLPARLASRLVSGLVVGLMAPSASSRLALLTDKAQRRQLAVRPEVLAWLADHLAGGGRQLEGAIAQLEALGRLCPAPLDVGIVASHFAEQVEAARPTLERIAQRVSAYFRVETRQLQSRRRSRQVMVPRQVGMYLARQLTGLSLDQIGDYFGRRDHSTVLHACRKIARAVQESASLSGAVRQLQCDLA